MRKITIFAIGIICLAGVASGMGQAGAVEPTLTVEATATPIAPLNNEGRIDILRDERWVWKAFAFVDSSGKTIKTVDIPKGDANISPNAKYALVIHDKREKTTAE